MLWLLSDSPVFACWIYFAPVFGSIYCWVLVFALFFVCLLLFFVFFCFFWGGGRGIYLCVLGDGAVVGWESYMRGGRLCVLVHVWAWVGLARRETDLSLQV